MSSADSGPPHALAPQPEQTPDALRAALAIVAPEDEDPAVAGEALRELTTVLDEAIRSAATRTSGACWA